MNVCHVNDLALRSILWTIAVHVRIKNWCYLARVSPCDRSWSVKNTPRFDDFRWLPFLLRWLPFLFRQRGLAKLIKHGVFLNEAERSHGENPAKSHTCRHWFAHVDTGCFFCTYLIGSWPHSVSPSFPNSNALMVQAELSLLPLVAFCLTPLYEP